MSRPAWVRYRPRVSRTAQQVRAGMTHTDYFCHDKQHLMDKGDPYCYHCATDALEDRVWQLEYALKRITEIDDPTILPALDQAQRIAQEALDRASS